MSASEGQPQAVAVRDAMHRVRADAALSWVRRRALLTRMSIRVWFGPEPVMWGQRITFALPCRYEIERLYGGPLPERWIVDQDELDDISVPRPGVTGRTVAMFRWPHGAVILRRR